MVSLVNCAVFGVFLYSFYYFFLKSKKYNFPPGPPFGGFFAAGSKVPLYIKFQELAKKYGGIIRIKFGLTDGIYLDDPDVIREAFNNLAFSGRMDHPFFTLLSEGKQGISTTDGPEWVEQRRFALRTLREFGFGKQSMEHFIMEEVTEFLKWMKEMEGIPTEVNRRFVLATVNSLWTLVAGKRHDQGDTVADQIIHRANQIFTEAGNTSRMLIVFPGLINILPKRFLTQWNAMLERVGPLIKIFKDAVDDHLKNPAEENSPRDLIDVYLTEIKKTKDPNSSFYKDRGYKSLVAVIGDLYGAGQGTTSNTLTWTVLYLVKFPEIQEKLQKELNDVIGKNRLPTLADRQK